METSQPLSVAHQEPQTCWLSSLSFQVLSPSIACLHLDSTSSPRLQGVLDMMHVPGCPGGYYVNAGNTPRALRWIPKTSLIGHAFEGLCSTEFKGLQFDGTLDGRGDTTGEQVGLLTSVRGWAGYNTT